MIIEACRTCFSVLAVMMMMKCPNTIIVNESEEWNKIDALQFESSRKRCGEIYPDAPCLKWFVKKAENTYWAVCGKQMK